MPGKKLRNGDRAKLNTKYFCSSCSLLLNQPMQTTCGHLFCSSCIEELLKKPSSRCPVDEVVLKREEIFPDNFTRREISVLIIHCPNERCKWTGQVKELEAHLAVCGESLVPCEQCKQQVKRASQEKHLKEDCEYRKVLCPHCQEEIAFAILQEHEKYCSAFPVTCPHCKKTNIPRKDLERHENIECEEIETACEYAGIGCNYVEVSKRRELRQHASDGLIFHVRLLLNKVLEVPSQISNAIQPVVQEFKQLTSRLSNEVREQAEKFSSLFTTVGEIDARVGNLESRSGNTGEELVVTVRNLKGQVCTLSNNLETSKERNRRLENEVKEMRSLIERMRAEMNHLSESMAITTVKLGDVQEVSVPNNNGTLLWRIDNFERKRQDAVSGVQTAIYSPHFYSSPFGYKMCARIYMNGDGFGKDTHISLFFVVMMGEYDALLTWPFQKKITMMLLDQGNGDHMIDSFRSDPQSSSFQRPKTKLNIASGSPLFMPLSGLKNGAYVKDNTMFIKIIVD